MYGPVNMRILYLYNIRWYDMSHMIWYESYDMIWYNCIHFADNLYLRIVCIYNYLHTYIHTYIHAYIHIYIYVFIYIYICITSRVAYLSRKQNPPWCPSVPWFPVPVGVSRSVVGEPWDLKPIAGWSCCLFSLLVRGPSNQTRNAIN
jgi:hypothetical protein